MLSHLKAFGFRNLEPLNWQPGAGVHLLVGDNGAGKTSVLEAIYVLATTRSFRVSSLASCVRHGHDVFRLTGGVEGERRVDLEVSWSEGEGLFRAVNGKSTPLAEHLAAMPVVAWTAGEGEILDGAPALRRRFLDRGVVGIRPAALEALARYRRSLAQKREILGRETRRRFPLTPWNELLAVTAAEIVAARREYAERLSTELAAVLAIAELDLPPIGLLYRPSLDGGGEAILAALGRLEETERRRGMPLAGPHRDDLEVRWGAYPVKEVASAGERKALSLLLSAAHGRVMAAAGRPPIYLLDDLDAELAAGTLRRLWPVFEGAIQLFVTSNRPRIWEGLAVAATWPLKAGSGSFPKGSALGA